MTLLRRDMNEARIFSIMLLPKDNNPNYYTMLFRNAKNFFRGMNHPELVQQLDFIINQKIERTMNSPINNVLLVYKNLPALNSFTRSKHPLYANMNIYKYTIQTWLDEIEGWVFTRVAELEGEIRFTNIKQWV